MCVCWLLLTENAERTDNGRKGGGRLNGDGAGDRREEVEKTGRSQRRVLFCRTFKYDLLIKSQVDPVKQLIDDWMSLKRTTRTHVDGIQAQRNTCFNNHTLILFYFFVFLKKSIELLA